MIVFTHEHESSSNNKGLGSRWLAVDKRNGDIRWELARKTERNSYMTPCVYTTSTGQDQLIFTSLAHGVSAVDPLTGTVLWEVPNVFDGRTIGSPVLMGDKIVATSGAGSSGKVLVVVQAPQTDQPARVLHRIETDLAPFVPTNLALGNRLYTFHDQGTIGCWDIDKGQPVWTEKTPYKFYGSPIALGQHIYCITTKGEVLVLQAGDTYQALAITPLDEKSQATPAVSDGRLYLRTLTQIVCVGT
jgi:outer membrane protein assembly factor BamB